MDNVLKKRMSMIIHYPSVNVSIPLPLPLPLHHVYLIQIVVQGVYVYVHQALLGAVYRVIALVAMTVGLVSVLIQHMLMAVVIQRIE